jgi:hypothetical protein
VKLSPTHKSEDDEQYEDKRHNYEAEHHARQRHRGRNLICCTHMQREKYNLNQHARQLDVCEAHLCRRECRCDRREAKIRAARMRGTDTDTGMESGSE